MKRGPGVATLVERALLRDAARCGVEIAVTTEHIRPWASVTFAGARHRITLAGASGPTTDAWLAGIAGHDLPVSGHLIADAVIVESTDAEGQSVAVIELLSVEER